jgi:hypothetical protein
LHSVEIEVLVGGCADEDLVDVFGSDVSVASDADAEGSGESVDEKVKELVLVDTIVCLLWVYSHNLSKQTLPLTAFVRY